MITIVMGIGQRDLALKRLGVEFGTKDGSVRRQIGSPQRVAHGIFVEPVVRSILSFHFWVLTLCVNRRSYKTFSTCCKM